MKNYQDTETGMIYAFEEGSDPFTANNRNIPETLTEEIKLKPDDSHVWHQGDWIKQEDAPPGYTPPIFSVLSFNPAWMAHLHPYTAIYRDLTSGLGSLPHKIPCSRVAMLGVDKDDKGQQLGSKLMKHALLLSQQVAKQIGSFGVYLDADPWAVDFYQKLGFALLVGNKSPKPSPMFLPLGAIA